MGKLDRYLPVCQCYPLELRRLERPVLQTEDSHFMNVSRLFLEVSLDSVLQYLPPRHRMKAPRVKMSSNVHYWLRIAMQLGKFGISYWRHHPVERRVLRKECLVTRRQISTRKGGRFGKSPRATLYSHKSLVLSKSRSQLQAHCWADHSLSYDHLSAIYLYGICRNTPCLLPPRLLQFRNIPTDTLIQDESHPLIDRHAGGSCWSGNCGSVDVYSWDRIRQAECSTGHWWYNDPKGRAC
ncbi:hypothetical protein BDP81DRAFT_131507 [Colletotrichum phormii]|uniref:Uncharacterized protein n=1 Tax=Colletotrichum phormii TaxID=359342 RepID=A0AAJ0A0R5_9PEZI|nr:uncharacterized protein BDP81DRAFT_131507 [Colletotrichum phormii]KAK1641310.1 hypothetical protein BDP81DRAFT_131507 [Colletotrichum phormii]